MKKIIISFIAIIICANIGFAKDIEFNRINKIGQSEFESFVKEFGMAISFAPMSPAEPLGITGFDISGEILSSNISGDEGFWKKVTEGGEEIEYLPVPRLHVQKGLPFGFDVGAMYLAVPDSNIKLWGIEAKYAIIEGGIAMPALSIRGSYSQLTGVKDLNLDTQSLDLMISKGILIFTPYAGVSMIRINSSDNVDEIALEDVEETLPRYFLGLQFSPLPLIVLNFEAGYGEIPQFGLKLGIRF